MTFIGFAKHLAVVGLVLLMAACGGGGDDANDPSRSATGSTTDRSARLSVSSTQTTGPVAPFTANGWYWNPAEGGTGFMFEAQGTRAFVGFFMYEEGSGKPIWYVATGDLTNGDAAGDHRFSGDLRVYHGGMGLTDRIRTSPTSRSLGTVGIDFVGGRAIVALPGGRVMNAERFCAGGPCVANPAAPSANTPETGWYWNPDEGGRGYAIEHYNGNGFMGIFHYNPDGSPVWHVSSSRTGRSGRFLELYTGGQSLTSSYRNATGHVVSSLGLQTTKCAGQLQIPSLPVISLRRFVIDGATPPAGFECTALAGLVDVPDIHAAPFSHDVSAGNLVYGLIDSSGDADAYSIFLSPGTHTFDLLAAASGSGTLPDPALSLHDSNMTQVAENDDREPGTTESRITYTVASYGYYQLRVRSSSKNAGSGSFLLKVGGSSFQYIDPGTLVPASGYQGVFTGKLLGADPADLILEVKGDGSVGGMLKFKNAEQSGYIGGSVAPGGTLMLSQFSLSKGLFECKANLVLRPVRYGTYTAYDYIGIFGNCGDHGMLVGNLVPRVPSTPIVAPALATVGEPVPLSSTIPAGNPSATYEWQFGDGGIAPGSGAQTHVYSSPGTYVIRLIEQPASGGNPTTYTANLTVVCVDGTICTDFEEPAPWATIDSVGCELRDIPPSATRRYAKGPVITFAGRARVPLNYRMIPVASRERLPTEDAFLAKFPFVFSVEPLGQQWLDAACDGRTPCRDGPITTFFDSPLNRADRLEYMFSTSPPPFWLYVAVFDRSYSRLYSLVEKEVTCPAFVPLPATPPP